MTKISLYSVDTNIQGNDKWIGSDAQNYNATKNFTPDKVAEYLNHNQVIDIGTLLRYTYQTLEPLEQRRPGTISFITEIGSEVNFSDITTFLLSKFTLKGNDVSQYLNFLNGSKVVISKADNTDIFGFYKITNVEVYLPEPNFFNVTLTYIDGNGFIKEDLDYIISLVIDKYNTSPTHTSQLINDGADGVHPFITAQDIPPSASTLQDVTTNGNTTTNDIILNSTIGKYGDYTAQNDIQDLGAFQTLSSPTNESYTSYYSGYGFGISSSFNTLSKSIYGQESLFYIDSSDSTNNNYNGTISLQATDSLGSPYLSLINKLGNEGKLKATNLTNNNVVLQFPNKTTGSYTIATTDDIYTPTLQQVLDNNHDLVNGNNFQGTLAGKFNTGYHVNAFGENSATTNTGNSVNAFGIQVLQGNTANYVNGFGAEIGLNNIYKNVNLFGYRASADADNQTVFSKWSIGSIPHLGRLSFTNITADRKWELQDANGTLALTSDIPSFTPSALTKTDDTNVTLTLGGSPSTALLQGVSLTLGWTGTLADSRIASATTWNSKQNPITLTTIGTGVATFVGNVLNIPTPSASNFVSLTTTGASGSSTLVSGVLNVPTYTLSGLGGVPTSRTLTINGTTLDLTANRSWSVGDLLSSGSYANPSWLTSLAYSKLTGAPTIPTVGTWGALNYPTWTSGTPFVKMTAAGTFALDTNTYVTYSTYGSNNVSANNFFDGFTSVVASGIQITLTLNSTPSYLVTGSGGQVIKLPDATTLPNGSDFYFNNNQSSGAISVNNNSNTLVKSVPSGGYLVLTLIDNSTSAGSWDTHFQSPSNVSWSTNTFDYGGSITSATWNGVNVALNRGGTGANTASGARTNLGSTTVGDNFFTLTNPSAITFVRINADNTISTLDASTFRTAIGAGTSSTNGTVTSVSALTLATSGTDLSSSVATGTTTPVITLNVPTASATNRGALSSTDWTTFNNKQDKSTSAYSFRVNNTNATANATETTYKSIGQQAYTGTITWTGTTPPSGATSFSYNWTQIGNLVTLKITLVYANAGTLLSAVNMTLPSDCPTPLKPTGLSSANNILYSGVGFLGINLTAIPSATARVVLRINSTNNGFEVLSTAVAAAYLYSDITLQYYTS